MVWLKRCFFLLIALIAIQIIFYYPRMPAVVASHFDGAGVPNGWSGRDGFFSLYIAIVTLLVAVFLWAPRRLGSGSGFGRNIPRPEYWLAPGRIEHTRAFMQRQLMLMGVVHLGLALYVAQLVILANLAPLVQIDASIFIALGSYFVFVFGWLAYLQLHFRKKHE